MDPVHSAEMGRGTQWSQEAWRGGNKFVHLLIPWKFPPHHHLPEYHGTTPFCASLFCSFLHLFSLFSSSFLYPQGLRHCVPHSSGGLGKMVVREWFLLDRFHSR